MLEAYKKEQPDRLIFLGDILYHGPRNDLPKNYAPKEVIAQLSPLKEKILCVRGNCDCEVDQMVLPFPVLADYGFLELSGRAVYLTHGHVINKAHPLPFSKGDILLHGHTHVPRVKTAATHVSEPRLGVDPEGKLADSYMIFEDGVFS